MRKIRTREELLSSIYVNQTEIQQLFGIGRTLAHRVFIQAFAVDRKELGDRLLCSNRVRLVSCCTVTGIPYKQLVAQVKSGGLPTTRQIKTRRL